MLEVAPGLKVISPPALPRYAALLPAGKKIEFGALGRVALDPTLLSLMETGKIRGWHPLMGCPLATHCVLVTYTVPVVEGLPVISPVMGVPIGMPAGVVEE